MSDSAQETEEGRGALIGEFLQSFFSAPKNLQDDVIFHAIKSVFASHAQKLIHPYPVLSHLRRLIEKSSLQGPSR